MKAFRMYDNKSNVNQNNQILNDISGKTKFISTQIIVKSSIYHIIQKFKKKEKLIGIEFDNNDNK